MSYLGCLLFCLGSSQQILVLADVLVCTSYLLLNVSGLNFLGLHLPLQVSERKAWHCFKYFEMLLL